MSSGKQHVVAGVTKEGRPISSGVKAEHGTTAATSAVPKQPHGTHDTHGKHPAAESKGPAAAQPPKGSAAPVKKPEEEKHVIAGVTSAGQPIKAGVVEPKAEPKAEPKVPVAAVPPKQPEVHETHEKKPEAEEKHVVAGVTSTGEPINAGVVEPKVESEAHAAAAPEPKVPAAPAPAEHVETPAKAAEPEHPAEKHVIAGVTTAGVPINAGVVEPKEHAEAAEPTKEHEAPETHAEAPKAAETHAEAPKAEAEHVIAGVTSAGEPISAGVTKPAEPAPAAPVTAAEHHEAPVQKHETEEKHVIAGVTSSGEPIVAGVAESGAPAEHHEAPVHEPEAVKEHVHEEGAHVPPEHHEAPAHEPEAEKEHVHEEGAHVPPEHHEAPAHEPEAEKEHAHEEGAHVPPEHHEAPVHEPEAVKEHVHEEGAHPPSEHHEEAVTKPEAEEKPISVGVVEAVPSEKHAECKHEHVQVVAGVTAGGEPILSGVIELPCEGTSVHGVHHVESSHKFETEDWSGEHAEHPPEHHEAGSAEEAHEVAFSAGPAEAETAPKHDEDTPIASSKEFERNRSASLAEALQHIDPKGVPQVGFVSPANVVPLLEAEESEERAPTPVATCATESAPEPEPAAPAPAPHPSEPPREEQEVPLPESGEAERTLTDLLFTLHSLKMTAPDRHADAVNRLKELEEELRAAGAVTPADPAVADAVARALTAAGPGRDIQIRVNQSRHTTTTKTVYETETPGMVGLDPEKIRELHQQMLGSLTSAGVEAAPDAGTTQKKETAEEGFTNEDGSVVVSKKMTRVVTTTKTTLPGDAEPAPGE